MGKVSCQPARGQVVWGNPDALDEFWRTHRDKRVIRRRGTVGEARRTLAECQAGYDTTWFLSPLRELAEDALLSLPDYLLPLQNSVGCAIEETLRVEETLRNGFRRECFERLERTLIVLRSGNEILYANMYATPQEYYAIEKYV